MGKLFLVVMAWVVLELSVMIKVGAVIGALTTVALLLLMAVLGGALVRSEGLKTLLSAQQKIQQGSVPNQEMLGGVLLALAGVLLVFPGFVSDLFALLLLQPWLRQRIAERLLKSSLFKFSQGASASPFGANFHSSMQRGSQEQQSATIEGEFERKD